MLAWVGRAHADGGSPRVINQDVKVSFGCTAPVTAMVTPTRPFGHPYPPAPWPGRCCAWAG